MDIGNGLHQIRENANRGLYQNLRYQTERISKKNIIIDTNKINISQTSNQTNFRTSLVTPLKIDTNSEVYIDSIYFIGEPNPTVTLSDLHASQDTLDQALSEQNVAQAEYDNAVTNSDTEENIQNFNTILTEKQTNYTSHQSYHTDLKANYSNQEIYDNIIGHPITLNIQLLGNSSSSNNDAIDGNMLIVVDELKSNSATQKSVAIIKNKKLNYISTINPMNIQDIEFTLKLSDDNKSIFRNNSNVDNKLRVIFEIVIVSKE